MSRNEAMPTEKEIEAATMQNLENAICAEISARCRAAGGLGNSAACYYSGIATGVVRVAFRRAIFEAAERVRKEVDDTGIARD